VSNPLADIEATCAGFEQRMAVLRQVRVPGAAALGPEVHRALLDVRARLDAAEVLKTETRRLRRKFRNKAAQRAEEAEEEFDRQLGKLGEGAVMRQYEGAQERMSRARTLNLDFRRRANTAKKVSQRVDDMFDAVTDMFFGLLNVREELLARMRELASAMYETGIERDALPDSGTG
jgi:hypothetical protein